MVQGAGRSPAADPPEATPEPPTPTRVGSVEQAVKAAGSTADILDGLRCEFGMVGVSVPSRSRLSPVVIDPDFVEKAFEPLGVESADEARSLFDALGGAALACRKGKKPEQPNQDNYFFCDTPGFRLLCVADGHGEMGHWVSHWAARMALRLLLLELSDLQAFPEDDEMLASLFDTVHLAVKSVGEARGVDLSLSGTTFSIVVIDRQSGQAVLSWVGDSRCVVGRQGATRGVEVLHTSVDHKPQDMEERRRIIGSGGEVARIHEDMPSRVFARGKEAPGLAMSRAIGDLMAHSVGVIHAPSIKRFTLEANQVLILCSDGVWEFMKNAEALRLVVGMGRDRGGEAAAALASEAWDRWIREEGNATDDITAMVLWW
uniref:PPM-type phosphatase domain-containing protein n=1 Tax=Zooxanthella nutricula TaxID=1333877 RepID=A0A7S2JPF2_9DINO